MNLKAVVDFINGNKVLSRYLLPKVGHEDPGRPVVAAKADGSKLALVVSGMVLSDGPYGVVGSFVREVIPSPNQLDGSKKIRIVIDAPFPEQALDLVKIADDDAVKLKWWQTAHSSYDDEEESATKRIDEVLANISDPGQPALQKHFKFVRWSEWDANESGLNPRGVILVSPERRLYAVGFPGAESDAQRWARFAEVPEDALDHLQTIAGRTVFISTPETIRAVGWEDAPERALHKFGADYYAESGRTMFP